MWRYEDICKATHQQGHRNTGECLDLSAGGTRDTGATSWVGLVRDEHSGVWTGLRRGRFSLEWGQAGERQAPRLPVAAFLSRAPEPWRNDRVPWESALPPGWGLSNRTPAQPSWCHLEMTWKCGATCSQVPFSKEFGPVCPMVHAGVCSVGCRGKEMREECGATGGEDGDTEKWSRGE